MAVISLIPTVVKLGQPCARAINPLSEILGAGLVNPSSSSFGQFFPMANKESFVFLSKGRKKSISYQFGRNDTQSGERVAIIG